MTTPSQQKKSNALVSEKSPYLLQHAFNPVDWNPWGETAFEKARREQKPIFLSIGYSTCHWCHVMERESFESEATAAILNELFVSIKVDREERPDVDRVYMNALQSMGENGGWPLSMFLTPDLKPFYGGTYFPPETRYGRYGFPEILRQVHRAWETDRENVLKSAENLISFLNNRLPQGSIGVPGEKVYDACYDHFLRAYDPTFGGFGGAPKFPRPSVLQFLLMHGHYRAIDEPAHMVIHTLEKMKWGGLYDQIGGGFHRYSVDAEWRVPHFEKMLYDQAQIVMASVDAYRFTRNAVCANIIEETLGYVLRDMREVEGGFFSAEDADSRDPENGESAEGAFYVWRKSEIENLLPAKEAAVFTFVFGVEAEGNALADPHQEFLGKNILFRAHSVEEASTNFNLQTSEVESILENARRILLKKRTGRSRPLLDDKVLSSWNGMMISAFARSYQVLGRTEFLHAATKAVEFVMTRLFHQSEGTLWRRYRDGESKWEAHLEDYAFLVQGLLDLFESTGSVKYLRTAIALTEKQVELFWDEKDGGLFDTSGRDPSILVRMKDFYDGAEPSGNAVTSLNLIKLSAMTDRQDFLKKAERSFSYFRNHLDRNPYVMPFMTYALGAFHKQPKQVVILGDEKDERTGLLRRAVFASYAPHRVVLLVEPGDHQKELAAFAPFVNSLELMNKQPTAFVCENFVCNLPVTDPARLAQLLA